jgi:hypothetical protein
MRRFLFIAATTLAMSAGSALAREVLNLNVNGTNLDGSTYRGTTTVTWISDTTCTIVWNTGADPIEGICMRNGDAFAAAYTFASGANGVVLYKIIGDQQLEGLWTVTGLNGYGTESLSPQQ